MCTKDGRRRCRIYLLVFTELPLRVQYYSKRDNRNECSTESGKLDLLSKPEMPRLLFSKDRGQPEGRRRYSSASGPLNSLNLLP